MCVGKKKKGTFLLGFFTVYLFRFEAQADLAAKMMFQEQQCEIIYFMTLLFCKIQGFGLKMQGKIFFL